MIEALLPEDTQDLSPMTLVLQLASGSGGMGPEELQRFRTLMDEVSEIGLEELLIC